MAHEHDAALLTEVATHLRGVRNDAPLTAQRIGESALQVVPEAEHASLTVRRRGGRFVSLGSTSETAVQADQAQYTLSEGPCVDTIEHADFFRSGDVANDPRWPTWGRSAAQLGLVSALAGELTDTGGRRLGCLNLYWRSPRDFTGDDRSYIQIFTTHAAIALASSMRDAQLNTALDARKVIGQAQGILMERHSLRADQAFEVLRRYSQNHNIKLREVTEFLVTARALPTSRAQVRTTLDREKRASG